MPKAVVLGAAGGIGQPLSLLLKGNPLVTELGLYDILNTPGVAADLSHINTQSKVEGFLPPDDSLTKALTGAAIVVIPAGVPKKPGTTKLTIRYDDDYTDIHHDFRDDLFKVVHSHIFPCANKDADSLVRKINAGIVRDLATGIAKTCPKAFILVISNPVNSTVPIVGEVLKQHGVFDPKRLFGVTTLDVVRASTFFTEKLGDVSLASSVSVPVIGGHSGVTVGLHTMSQFRFASRTQQIHQIVPLFSQSSHSLPPGFTASDLEALTTRVQFAGDEVVKAKDGAGSATLSMAYAAAEFAAKILRAIKGETGITTPTYINLASHASGGEALKEELGKEIEYFSAVVELGSGGVSRILPLGKVTEFEKKLISAALTEIAANIEKGVSFIKGPKL